MTFITINDSRVDEALSYLEKIPAIKHSFDCGGYIAGGFPRYLFGAQKNIPVADVVKNHYVNRGDIDVFFPNEQAKSAAINRIANDCCYQCMKPSKLKTAIDITIEQDDPRPRLQLITCNFGDEREVVGRFDFTNSMAFLAKGGFVVDDLLPDLEEQKLIDIRIVKKATLTYRLAKYANRYKYLGLTDRSKDVFFEFIQSCSSNELKHFFGSFGRSLLRNKGMVDDKVIVLLTSVLGKQAYSELFRRYDIQDKDTIEAVGYSWLGQSTIGTTTIALSPSGYTYTSAGTLRISNTQPLKSIQVGQSAGICSQGAGSNWTVKI